MAITVTAGHTRAGVTTTVATGAPLRYLRIRRSGTDVLWELSADGASWSVLAGPVPAASLPPLTGLRARIRSSGTGVGNYSLPAVGQDLPTITIEEHFDSKNTTVWDWFGSARVGNGYLLLDPVVPTGNGNGIISRNPIDLSAGPVWFRVSQMPTAQVSEQASLAVSLTASSTDIGRDRLWFRVPQGGGQDVEAHRTSGGTDISTAIAHDGTWLRIRRSGTDVVWEMSFDGISWAVQQTTPAALLPPTSRLWVAIFATGAATSTGSFGIGSVNVVPATPPPPPPVVPGTSGGAVLTFAEALLPFVTDGSLKHFYPLDDTYTTTDVRAGLSATNTGGVTFSPAGATFTGANHLEIADHDDFSLTTTDQMTVMASQTVDDWAGVPGVDGFVHWMGKGATSTTQEWTFRHYPANDPARPKRTSVYCFSPSDTLGNGHLGAGSYFQHDDPTGLERTVVARFDRTTASYPDHDDFDAAFPGMVQLFKDGTLRDTDGFYGSGGQYRVAPGNTTSPTRLGTRDLVSFFKGKLRRFAVFNRKLTDSEIAKLHEASTLPEGSWSGGVPSKTFAADTRDDFSPTFSPIWTTVNNATIVNGECRIATAASTGSRISTSNAYTLKNNRAAFKMGPVVDTTGGTATGTYTRARINATADTTTLLDILIRPMLGTISFRSQIAGSDQVPATGSQTIPYSPVNHAWVRFRETAGTIHFETSPDGTGWSVQRTDATPAWIGTAPDQRLYIDTLKSTGPVSYAVIDSVNTSPIPLVDTFDTKNVAMWDWKGGATTSKGALVLEPDSRDGVFANGVISRGTISLEDGPVHIEIAGFPAAPASGVATLEFSLTTSSTALTTQADRIWAAIPMTTAVPNNWEARTTRAGTTTTTPLTGVRPWIRISRSGTDILWEDSPDGVSWTTRHTAAATIPTTDLYVSLVATGDAANRGAHTIGGVNVPQPPPVVVPPGPPTTLVATPGASQLALSWTPPASNGGSPVLSYVLRGPGSILTLTATGHTFANLPPGQQVVYSVAARNSAGEGPARSVAAIPGYPVVSGVPGPPTSVEVVGKDESAFVSWLQPAVTNGAIKGFHVLDTGDRVVAVVVGNIHEVTVTNLPNGISRTVRVVATNIVGDGLPSVPSNTFTPAASGAADSTLATRASFGALPGAVPYQRLEIATGRAMNPVAIHHKIGSAFPAGEIDAMGQRDRSPLLLLDLAGVHMSNIANGSLDAELDKLGVAIGRTGRTVHVAPLYAANDRTQPWSPLHGPDVPGYAIERSCYTTGVAEYLASFRQIARRLRGQTGLASVVWVIDVDPQPDAAADDWLSYYPGPAADTAALLGRNHGVGPIQGLPGQTEWRSPFGVFDRPYATISEFLPVETTMWLMASCHDPASVFTPQGPGFAPGAAVPADPSRSKAGWVASLLESTAWPRVQALVWDDRKGTRNWSIMSSTGSQAAFQVRLGDTVGWVRTEVAQDELGDLIRAQTDGFARWVRGGRFPATRDNEYARPDARQGVRGALVHATPYSAGPKQTAPISTGDMKEWNRLHGLLLRQVARHGMQGWASASGDLPLDHSALLHPGGSTGDGVVLTSAFDAMPGPMMQSEGGMRVAESGASAPLTAGEPTITSVAVTARTASIFWAPPRDAPLSSIVGYQFTRDASWSSGLVVSPANPFVFTDLEPGTTYALGIAAVTAQGVGAQRLGQITTASAPPTSPVPPQGLPAKPVGLYWTYWTPGLARLTTYDRKYTAVYLFHAENDGNLGAVRLMRPTNIPETVYNDDIQTLRARGQRVLLTLGGAQATVNINSQASADLCYDTLVPIIDRIGGLDGLDLNNFESGSASSTPAWMAHLCKRLATKYGPGFTFTIPASVANRDPGGRAWADRQIAAALEAEGLLGMVAPQFYDGSNNATSATVNLLLDYYNTPVQVVRSDGTQVLAQIPRHRIGIGYRIEATTDEVWGDNVYWTASGAAAAYTAAEGSGREPRGAYLWSSGNETSVDEFISVVEPVITD